MHRHVLHCIICMCPFVLFFTPSLEISVSATFLFLAIQVGGKHIWTFQFSYRINSALIESSRLARMAYIYRRQVKPCQIIIVAI